VHPTAINAAIRKINAAGVPVMALINRFTDGGCVTLSAPRLPMATGIANYLIERPRAAAPSRDVVGRAIRLPAANARAGFVDALKKHPGID
jgi:ABC-type sugar transport system substrate-binding protein